MADYIRATFEGGYYFFTVVTYRRASLFRLPVARDCLREALDFTQRRRPFESVSFCLLPDHIHCVWRLPDGDADFSTRWASIKGRFSQAYRRRGGRQVTPSPSRQRKGEVSLWQRRFGEHQIRDERDLQRHVDYVHYNPLKHGLIERLEDWPWSSYHRYVRNGFYGGPDAFDGLDQFDSGDFGE
ncbi:MAG: REP-associated tyrosine transposase [Planctomycetota bacterium]|jgi:putative transposase